LKGRKRVKLEGGLLYSESIAFFMKIRKYGVQRLQAYVKKDGNI
jgi:hypothetical protein